MPEPLDLLEQPEPGQQEQEQQPPQQESLAERGRRAAEARRKAAAGQTAPQGGSLVERGRRAAEARRAALPAAPVAPAGPPVAQNAPPVAQTAPVVAPAAPAMPGVTSGSSTAVVEPQISDRTRKIGTDALQPSGPVAAHDMFTPEPRRSPSYYRLQDYKGDDKDRDWMKDIGAMWQKGMIGIPETVVGLADLARTVMSMQPGTTVPMMTGDSFGKMAKDLGLDFKEAKEYWSSMESDVQQNAEANVANAGDPNDGILRRIKDKAVAAGKNPGAIVSSVVESLPTMVAGGGVARATMAAAPAMSPVLAGAIGEGATTAGQNLEGARQDSPAGYVDPLRTLGVAASGAVTGAIGVFSGKLAQRLGIADVESMLAGAAVNETARKSLVKQVLYGAFQEGFLEELPQSVQEQVAQNVASQKPIWEGVDEAAVMGAISGGVMGGGSNLIEGGTHKVRESYAARKKRQLSAEQLIKQAKAPFEQAAPTAAPPVAPSPTTTEVEKGATPPEEAPGRLAGLRTKIADAIAPEAAKEREAAKTQRDEARRAAEVSPLTGLGNKVALARARPAVDKDPSLAWVVADGKQFKGVNDALGHDVGDEALKHFGKAMEQAADEMGIPRRVFHPGGDEFAAAVPRDKADAYKSRVIELSKWGRDGVETFLNAHAGSTFAEADKQMLATKRKVETPADREQKVQSEIDAAMGVNKTPNAEQNTAEIAEPPVSVQPPGPAHDVAAHDVKSVISLNGFKDHVQRLVDERGVAPDDAERQVVQLYRDIMASGMSAKDAKGEMADEVEALIKSIDNKADSAHPVVSSTPTGEQHTEKAAVEREMEALVDREEAPAPARGVKREKPKKKGKAKTLPEGHAIEKLGEPVNGMQKYKVIAPDGRHMTISTSKGDEEAVSQALSRMRHGPDWRRVTDEELEAKYGPDSGDVSDERVKELAQRKLYLESLRSSTQADKERIAEELEAVKDRIERSESHKVIDDVLKRGQVIADRNYRSAVSAAGDARLVPKPLHQQKTDDDKLHAAAINALVVAHRRATWRDKNVEGDPFANGISDADLSELLEEDIADLGPEGEAAKPLTAAQIAKVRELTGVPLPGEKATAPAPVDRGGALSGLSDEDLEAAVAEATAFKKEVDDAERQAYYTDNHSERHDRLRDMESEAKVRLEELSEEKERREGLKRSGTLAPLHTGKVTNTSWGGNLAEDGVPYVSDGHILLVTSEIEDPKFAEKLSKLSKSVLQDPKKTWSSPTRQRVPKASFDKVIEDISKKATLKGELLGVMPDAPMEKVDNVAYVTLNGGDETRVFNGDMLAMAVTATKPTSFKVTPNPDHPAMVLYRGKKVVGLIMGLRATAKLTIDVGIAREALKNPPAEAAAPEKPKRGISRKKNVETADDHLERDLKASVKPKEKAEPEYEYSSTQVQLPADVGAKMQAFAATIPDAELAEDGRENDPHVTVKFGLHGAPIEELRQLLAGQGPITLELGKMSLFKSPEADVLKVDVESEDLVNLNEKIAAALPNTDTHPQYRPHATIAYLKPGEGAKYSGDKTLAGTTVTIDKVTFSDRNGEKVEIPLVGKSEPVGEPAVQSEKQVPPKGEKTRGITREAGKSEQEVTPAKPKEDRIRDKLLEKAQSAREAALERIKARGKRALAGLDPAELADYAIVGASYMVEGAVRFADFSEKMIAEFGEGLRPHLRALFASSVTELSNMEEAAAAEVGEDVTIPQEKGDTPALDTPDAVADYMGLEGETRADFLREVADGWPMPTAEALSDHPDPLISHVETARDYALNLADMEFVDAALERGEDPESGKKFSEMKLKKGETEPGETRRKHVQSMSSSAQQAVEDILGAYSDVFGPEGAEVLEKRGREIADALAAGKTELPWIGGPSQQTDEEVGPDGDVGADVEGGAKEHGPDDVRGAGEERRAGDARERSGDESAEGVRGEPAPSREGEPATEGVRPEGKPSPQPAGDGEGDRVQGDARAAGGSERVAERVRGQRKPDADVKGTDFRITPEDAIGKGGVRQKARDNLAAIELAQRITREGRPATREEQAILAKYVGWGGLKPVFEPAGDKFYQEIHDKLRALVSEADFRSARSTILNAHYTAPSVVEKMWAAVQQLGFKSGKVLEPGAGVGNFMGLAPDAIRGKTTFTAIEKDPVTAMITSLLYPRQNVIAKGFEEANVADNYYDLAIGNPPYGDYGVNDRSTAKEFTQHIHDYFAVRALRAVRPGGLLAFVTSDGTMDKMSATVRKELAKNARLVAAIRLPNNAFKENAGTAVTTDIIILQKRAADDASPGIAWERTVPYNTKAGTFRINEYFASRPGQMLGHLEKGGQYGGEGDQKLVSDEGASLPELLEKKIAELPSNILTPRPADKRTAELVEAAKPLPPGVQTRDGGMFVVKNGDIMRRVGNGMVDAGVPKSRRERVAHLIALRDDLNEVLRLNREGSEDTPLENAQKLLQKTYNSFLKKYGPINKEERVESAADEEGERTLRVSYPNLWSFEHDPESAFVRALEVYDYEQHQEKGDKYRPKLADLVERRTIVPREPKTSADGPADAVLLSLNEKGSVDLDYIAQLLNTTPSEARHQLRGQIFHDPATGEWLTADQYLSGNVKDRMAVARAEQERLKKQSLTREDAADLRSQADALTADAKAAEDHDPEHAGALRAQARRAFEKAESIDSNPNLDVADNIKALEKVIPKDIPPGQIAGVLGAPWIPVATIRDFAVETFNLDEVPDVDINPFDAKWKVDARDKKSLKNIQDFGTKRVPGTKLLEHALNMTHPTVYDRLSDGSSVKNLQQTLLAEEKLQRIKDEFVKWIWRDTGRAEQHVRLYNDRFNTNVIPRPNGDHIETVGTAATINGREFAWQPHQRNFIARFLQFGRAGAFHVVGAGKTFAAAAAIMEAKRLGFVRKAMLAVPNHMLGQWTREFKQLYPGANLLVATEDQFEASMRKEFTARIASSDYDAIIITHSALERIQMSKGAQEAYIQQEIDELEQILQAKAAANTRKNKNKRNRMVRDLTKAQEKLKVRLKELQAEYKKDDLLDFEELGIDHLTVDEAHMFKNLNFNTTLKGVRGRPSQRAMDLEMKTRYLHKVNPKHSLMLLTGTPVSNTFAEVYVMQRYLQPEMLRARGLWAFDAWAKTFARERLAFEMAPSGSGFKQKPRFDKFVNLGELAQMFRMVADIQMAHPDPLLPGQKAKDFPTEPNLIRLERPPLIGGKPQVVTAPKTQAMADYMKWLVWRAKTLPKSWRPQKGDDNMLAVTNDGRMAALDLRLVDSRAQDHPENKLSIAAKNIAKIYHETAAIKGTQIIFSDVLRSSKTGVPGFEVYPELIRKLVEQGVKRNEIAIVHDHDGALAKMRLFMRVREGSIRILIGSTDKMGAGTNVQTRLVAEHQLDIRWRPADVEQRTGRILRQGNELYEEGLIQGVSVFPYVTEGSLDAFTWGMVARKAGMIHQALTADASTREIEDVDEQAMSAAEIAAAASGDPRIMRRAVVDAEVGRLDRLRRGYTEEQWERQREVRNLPTIIDEKKKALAAYQVDAKQAVDQLEKLGHEDVPPLKEGETEPLTAEQIREQFGREPALDEQAKIDERKPKRKFKVELLGKEYSTRGEANKALIEILKGIEKGAGPRFIGRYLGFAIEAKSGTYGMGHILSIEGKAMYDVELTGGERPIVSLENLPHKIPREITNVKEDLDVYGERLREAEERVNAPFEHEAELEKLKGELADLNAALAEKDENDKTDAAPDPFGDRYKSEVKNEDDVDDFYEEDMGDEPNSPMLSPAREIRETIGATRKGPSLDALTSPAAQASPIGNMIRTTLGLGQKQQSTALDRVQTLRAIVKNLSAAVDVPIRQGRFGARRRKARGVFFPHSEVARVIRMDMLDTAAHEVGHYVSKHHLGWPTRRKYGGHQHLSKLNKAAKQELVKLGKALYGTRKPAFGYGEEGIAEWAKLYVMDPAAMQKEAPEFTHWMEQEVLSIEPGLKAALDGARKQLETYKAASPEERFDAMINVKPENRWRPTTKGFVRKMLDDLNPIRLATEQLGGTKEAAQDPYLLARLTRGDAGVADEMVEHGIVDPETKQRVTRGLQEVLDDVGAERIQQFRRYLVAERVLELASRGINSGFDTADADAIAKANKAEFGQLAEEIWKISNALIDYRAKKGVLTAGEASNIQKLNKRRVGFYRVFTEEEKAAGAGGTGRGFSRNSSGIHAIKGSAREVIDPLESIISDIYNTVHQSHQAEVGLKLLALAETVEGGGRVVEVVEEPKIPITFRVGEIEMQMAQLGIQLPPPGSKAYDHIVMSMMTIFEPMRQAGPNERKDLVQPLVKDGRRVWVHYPDPDLYNAIAGLGTPQMPEWARYLGMFTRTLRAGATLTLEFMARNPFRDAWYAAMHSKAGRTFPGYHAIRGFAHMLLKSDDYIEWKQNGGDNAAQLGLDRGDVHRHLYSLMRSGKQPLFDRAIGKLAYRDTYKQSIQNGLSPARARIRAAISAARAARGWVLRPIDTLRMLSSIAENATRITEYSRVKRQALKLGAKPENARVEGVYAARDITLDFARAGTIGRQVNQLLAFFNANLQGWDKNWRELKENPVSTMGTWVAYLTLPSIALWAAQKDDPEYQKIPEWQKALAWIIIDRDANGNLKHIWRIPKPPELGILFATVPVKLLEYAESKSGANETIAKAFDLVHISHGAGDPRAFKHLLPSVQGLSPVPLYNGIPVPMGNMLQPLIEAAANYNFFTGRKIVPEGLEDLPSHAQATTRTGEFARQVGRATHISPAKFENTVKGYGAGLGQYGLDIGNIVTRNARALFGAEPFPRPPEASTEKLSGVPGVRGFIVRKPLLDAQPIQDAVDEYRRANAIRLEWKRRVANGQGDAADYFERHQEAIVAAASSEDGIRVAGTKIKVGQFRLAFNTIQDAQRASRDATPAEREQLAAEALKVAQDVLANAPIARESMRGLRRQKNEVLGDEGQRQKAAVRGITRR